MRVRCISGFPNEEQIKLLGEGFSQNQAFYITPGKEYTVLGLAFNCYANEFGTGVCVGYRCDRNYLMWAPLCLFDIVNDKASRFWRIVISESGAVELKPPSFFREHYYEDLWGDVPEIVEDFEQVWTLLQMEDNNELEP